MLTMSPPGRRMDLAPARSMRAALRQAQLQSCDIQHLNAHATSTLVGDRGELAAIRHVFGAGLWPIHHSHQIRRGSHAGGCWRGSCDLYRIGLARPNRTTCAQSRTSGSIGVRPGSDRGGCTCPCHRARHAQRIWFWWCECVAGSEAILNRPGAIHCHTSSSEIEGEFAALAHPLFTAARAAQKRSRSLLYV